MAETRWGEKFNLILWVLLDALERFFTENKLLKLISLAIAFFMWVSVSTQEQRDRTLQSVPLKVINQREDTVITNTLPKVVDVRVRGPAAAITDLDPQDLTVTVDASKLGPGNHNLPLMERVNTPPNIEVLTVDPPSIPVNVETKMTRQVPVKPQINLDRLPPDHVVLETRVGPPTVALTGPASEVNELMEVVTRPIDPSGVNSQATLTAALVIPDQRMSLTPPSVTVTISLDRVGERRFTNLKPKFPQRVQRAPAQPISVTLKGPQSLLDKIEPDDITVQLDVARLPRGEHEVSPSIELAEQFREKVRVSSIEPEKMKVRLR